MPTTRQGPLPQKTGRGCVLIVDDVLLVRMWIADFLRGRGFEVIEAASGEDAVRVLEAGCAVDVVVSDLYMPGAEMDGVALAHWVHDQRPELKIVLASGVTRNLQPDDQAICACPLLPKPYDHRALERCLIGVLQA
ncbi:MAG: response regulator [Alphaproteobacteria bacterium]|nr:response regulator [Alphaproteobacteria bacterium]MBV8409919.1 response regulator [Alphaproteobacteria bacterium]